MSPYRLFWQKLSFILQQVTNRLYTMRFHLSFISAFIFIALVASWAGYEYYEENTKTIYEVYMADEMIGTVDHPSEVHSWIDDQRELVEQEHAQKTLIMNKGFAFKPIELYKPEVNQREVFAEIEENFVTKMHAVKVEIDGQSFGYIADVRKLELFLEDLKKQYVNSEDWLAYQQQRDNSHGVMAASFSENQEEMLAINNPQLVDIDIKQNIHTEQELIDPELLIDEQELLEYLNQTKIEEKIHTIAQGEVLGTIASKYNLSVDEIIQLNPDLSVDHVLRVGDELIVEAEEPFVTVLTIEQVTEQESITYQVQTKKDDTMFKGKSTVEQEGRNGLKHLDYRITRENRQINSKILINETIIEEPIDRIVIEGSKVIPSRGTGDFAWPAVGGYQSSAYGMRWGRLHAGIDIARPSNRSILASDNGVVRTAGWHNGGYGNYVIIDHNNGYRTLYAHLSSINVQVGQTVQQGQHIGNMGATGTATGVHLHFEIHRNGQAINPAGLVRR